MLLIGAYGHQYWKDNRTPRRGEPDDEVGREGQGDHRNDKVSAADDTGSRVGLPRERSKDRPRGYYA